MPVKTQDAYTQQYCCFQPIKVSFYNYPFNAIHDRIPRTLSLSQTCLNMPADKIATQTLWFNSHLGHFLTWERSLDTLSGISPRYSSATNSQLTASSLYRYNMIANYAFFSQGSGWWGKDFLITLGMSGHLSTTASTPWDLHNSIRALLSHQPKGLGGCREILQWHCLPPSLYWGGGNRR